MRRIILTLAVALFSVGAPASPAAATEHAKAPHRIHHTLSPLALARERAQLRRARLELETQQALVGVSARLHLTLAQLVQKWQRVAICEVDGNWAMEGPYYSGIGFSNVTWDHFGGTRYAPDAGRATRMEQVLVGMRITRSYIPDQNGCSPYGW